MLFTIFSELSFQSLVAIITALALIALKIYLKATTGWCTSTKRLDGKTVIVTGANTGIGKETALDLAARGARVILACRNLEKANAAKEDIVSKTGNNDVVVKQLDLASLKSVRTFANDILRNESRLDILINNAGLAVFHPEWTEDGMEHRMQSNHFGHFLLTNMLLGLLKKSAPSRIINVSSESHRHVKSLDFDNIHFKTGRQDFFAVYGASKLCNILFTKELVVRLAGTGVLVTCCHPGGVVTDVVNKFPLWFKLMYMIFAYFFFKSAEEGAQTSIYLAVSDEVEGLAGKYFADCKVLSESKPATDKGLAKKLWEVSEALVKIQSDELHF